ncbi:MAG: radical SAM protein [Elusimicrobia bacterium]|nr:radical SAM protein [Elusimicrobiota bacterium]
MAKDPREQAEAADELTLRLPAQAARRLGLCAGSRLDVAVERGKVTLRPDIHSLAKVYLEPSSRCNLACRTCIRQTWSEPQGDMSPEVFRKLLKDLRRFPSLESIMLGGFGEPAVHPGLLSMVADLKALGLRVEMVSNGTRLDEAMGRGLLRAGLDRLWISLDGTEAETFEQVRKGARFKDVVRNVKRLREPGRGGAGGIAIGIAFVVTRKNLGDLKAVGAMARKIGADRVSVSNVIPYSLEMELQMACNFAVTLGTLAATSDKVDIDLPRLDAVESTKEVLWQLLAGGEGLSLMGTQVGARVDECRFIRERCACVRWDGKVAPCMGLMHAHSTFFQRSRREVQAYSPGDVTRQSLWEVWNGADYAAFREKVAAFDFSPCHVCGGCHLSEQNLEDCQGNSFPATCGGCLWAQGIIQCP